MKYPKHLQRLIENLKLLPGVGQKSAERFAFQLIDWKSEQLVALATLLQEIPMRLRHCVECGSLIDNACAFCDSDKRSKDSLCVVSSVKDVFAIEATGEYRGLYHVLEGVLSPLEGRGVDALCIDKLLKRLEKNATREVIIALDATLEGDATALYLKRELQNLPLTLSRLAFGLPMGSSFEYVDEGTLARALSGRASF